MHTGGNPAPRVLTGTNNSHIAVGKNNLLFLVNLTNVNRIYSFILQIYIATNDRSFLDFPAESVNKNVIAYFHV